MSDIQNHIVSSGVLEIGDMRTLRGQFGWLKWYYNYKGFDWAKVRSDIIIHYSYLVGQYSFRELLDIYAWDCWQWYCQEYCGVVNDNVWGGSPCTIEKWVEAPRIDGATFAYPTIKWHPMAKFRGWRISHMGMIFDKSLRYHMNRIIIDT